MSIPMLPDDDSFFALCSSEVWEDTEDTPDAELFPVEDVCAVLPSMFDTLVLTIKRWFAML